MKITKKEDGTLLVPQLVEVDTFIADTFIEITSDKPDYAKYLNRYEQEQSTARKI